MEKEGLYYRFSCRAQLPEGARCHLVARTGEKRYDLGLCIPQGEFFVTQTRLPVKHFSQGKYQFFLEQRGNERFVPLYPDQPFSGLGNLERGKLISRNGVLGILFPEGVESGGALAD